MLDVPFMKSTTSFDSMSALMASCAVVVVMDLLRSLGGEGKRMELAVRPVHPPLEGGIDELVLPDTVETAEFLRDDGCRVVVPVSGKIGDLDLRRREGFADQPFYLSRFHRHACLPSDCIRAQMYAARLRAARLRQREPVRPSRWTQGGASLMTARGR